jgi:hypothetical protein
MKYIKSARELNLSKSKIKDSAARTLKIASDYIKRYDIEIDKNVGDEEKLVKDIHLIISKFIKMWKKCEVKYKDVSSSWSDFLFYYNEFIKKYGSKPTKINKKLINDLEVLRYSLKDPYSGWISRKPKLKNLYYEIDILMQYIVHNYNELEDITNKYNL